MLAFVAGAIAGAGAVLAALILGAYLARLARHYPPVA
jgi:hypothetical protein